MDVLRPNAGTTPRSPAGHDGRAGASRQLAPDRQRETFTNRSCRTGSAARQHREGTAAGRGRGDCRRLPPPPRAGVAGRLPSRAPGRHPAPDPLVAAPPPPDAVASRGWRRRRAANRASTSPRPARSAPSTSTSPRPTPSRTGSIRRSPSVAPPSSPARGARHPFFARAGQPRSAKRVRRPPPRERRGIKGPKRARRRKTR